MVFRFCSLRCRSLDTFRQSSPHIARGLINNHRLEDNCVKEKTTENKEIPIIVCKRKLFNFYKGQSYNKKEEIALASHGWNHRKSRGDYFYIYPYEIDNQRKGHEHLDHGTFKDLQLDSSICSRLEHLDIKKPLHIQNLGIPRIFSGCNVVLAAETGCGKTLAYLLPLINQILQWKEMVPRPENCPLGLIVTPTRELATQIGLELINLSKYLGIQTKIVTGGKTKRMIINPPVNLVDVLVGSFGVLSKLSSVGVYTFDYIRYVVLDEADALFHHTFETKLNVFMKRLPIGYHQEVDENGFPKSAQLVLASATIPSRLQSVLGDIVNLDSLEYIKTENLHKVLVLQKFVRVSSNDKPTELLKYIKPKTSNGQRVIVFSNTSSSSYWVTLFLNECGVKTTNLNSTMPLIVRQGKYAEFLSGKSMVLSVTDAGSRGLDTLMVNHILNFDFPLDTGSYIHRCGRTGRVGTVGDCRVTNFISKPAEIRLVQKIEMATRKMKPFPIINLVESCEVEEEEDESDMEDLYSEEIIENMDDAENIPY